MENKPWLEGRFLSPVVVVAASAELEKTIGKNGLTMTQFLRPFTKASNDIHARVGEKDISNIKNFSVRLFEAESLPEMDTRLRVQHLGGLMAGYGKRERAFGDDIQSIVSEIVASKTHTSPKLAEDKALQLLERSYSQWHDSFIRDYVYAVRSSYFDTLDNPVAFIFAASSKEDSLKQFQIASHVPERVRENCPGMDDEALFYYILVHDLGEGSPSIEAARSNLQTMQSALGPNRCAMLITNSNTQSQSQCDPGLWVEANPSVMSFVTNGAPAKTIPIVKDSFINSHGNETVTGRHLSPGDLDAAQNVMNSFMGNTLVPFLERKLRNLVSSVNEKRQSTFSKVAAWFRNDNPKPKQESFVAGKDGVTTKYLFHSLEMQMRRTADIFLALRDFDAATNYYRMLRDELNSTISQREFNRSMIAAAQEGISFCFFFQGKLPLPGGGRHGECRLETARDEYMKGTVYSYAFRSSLILAAICRNRNPPANDRALTVLSGVLRSGSLSANKHYTAFVNELCGCYCLFLNPPMAANAAVACSVPEGFTVQSSLRKASKYFAEAGNRYKEAGVDDMALKCYLCALRVYNRCISGESWPSLFDHLYTSIGFLYHRQGNIVKGVSYFSVVAGEGSPLFLKESTAASMLERYLTQIRSVLLASNLTYCPRMVVPSLTSAKTGGLCITTDPYTADEITVAEATGLGDAMTREWANFDILFKKHYSHVRGHNLVIPRSSKSSSSFGERRSVHTTLGEPVSVTVTLRNPIGVTIHVENLSLLYVAEVDAAGSKGGIEPCVSPRSTSCSISPGGKLQVSLTFVAPNEGNFNIVGMSWTLCGVDGRFLFDYHTGNEPLKESLFEKSVENPHPPAKSEDYLTVQVSSPSASLSARFEPMLPPAMREGEIYHTNLVIANSSDLSAAKCVAIFRSPANAHLMYFPSFGSADNEDLEKPLVFEDLIVPACGSHLVPVIIRAQTDHTRSRSTNNIALVIGYATEQGSWENSSKPASPTVSPVIASPTSITPTVVSRGFAASVVRHHRIFRRIAVRPSIECSSVLIPTSSPSNAPTVLSLIIRNASTRHDAPMRICRLLVASSTYNSWRVKPFMEEILYAEGGVSCLLSNPESTVVSTIAFSRSKRVDVDVQKPGYIETLCLDPAKLVHTNSRKSSIEKTIGESVMNSVGTAFFLKNANVGCGRMGQEVEGEDDFSFYKDKAGGKGDESSSVARNGNEKTRQHPPVCVAVGWCVDEDGRMKVGQVFHMIDLIGQTESAFAKMSKADGKLLAPADSSRNKQGASLADSLRNCESHNGTKGLLLVTGRVMDGDPRSYPKKLIKLRLTLQNSSKVLLRVDLLAGQRQTESGLGVKFIGKNRHRFLIVSGETYETELFAVVPASGTYNLNSTEIKAVELDEELVPGATTGSAPPHGRNEKNSVHVTIVGCDSPWACTVKLPATTSPDVSAGRRKRITGQTPEPAGDRLANATTAAPATTATPVPTIIKRARGLSLTGKTRTMPLVRQQSSTATFEAPKKDLAPIALLGEERDQMRKSPVNVSANEGASKPPSKTGSHDVLDQMFEQTPSGHQPAEAAGEENEREERLEQESLRGVVSVSSRSSSPGGVLPHNKESSAPRHQLPVANSSPHSSEMSEEVLEEDSPAKLDLSPSQLETSQGSVPEEALSTSPPIRQQTSAADGGGSLDNVAEVRGGVVGDFTEGQRCGAGLRVAPSISSTDDVQRLEAQQENPSACDEEATAPTVREEPMQEEATTKEEEECGTVAKKNTGVFDSSLSESSTSSSEME